MYAKQFLLVRLTCTQRNNKTKQHLKSDTWVSASLCCYADLVVNREHFPQFCLLVVNIHISIVLVSRLDPSLAEAEADHSQEENCNFHEGTSLGLVVQKTAS